MIYISITICTYFHHQIYSWGKEKGISPFLIQPSSTNSLFPPLYILISKSTNATSKAVNQRK